MANRINTFDGENRFLSNFYYVPGGVFSDEDSIIYPSVEHAYQAAKTKSQLGKVFIKQLLTASEAKKHGKELELREDWDFVKDDIMYDLCSKKFRNKSLREKLLATGRSELIEGNTWGDTYWGVCKRKGKNKLGKILMKIREEIKEIKAGEPYIFNER